MKVWATYHSGASFGHYMLYVYGRMQNKVNIS